MPEAPEAESPLSKPVGPIKFSALVNRDGHNRLFRDIEANGFYVLSLFPALADVFLNLPQGNQT